MGCGKQQEAIAPIKSLVKLQPWFLSLMWTTCLRQNCNLGLSACSEGPALRQNTLMMMMMMMSIHKSVVKSLVFVRISVQECKQVKVISADSCALLGAQVWIELAILRNTIIILLS